MFNSDTQLSTGTASSSANPSDSEGEEDSPPFRQNEARTSNESGDVS